eukprot:gene20670-21349_t
MPRSRIGHPVWLLTIFRQEKAMVIPILDVALLAGIFLGAIIVVAAVFRFAFGKLDTAGITFAVIGFAFVALGFVSKFDVKSGTFEFNPPTEISQTETDLAAVRTRLDRILTTLEALKLRTGSNGLEIQGKVAIEPLETGTKPEEPADVGRASSLDNVNVEAPRVVIIWEASAAANGQKVKAAVAGLKTQFAIDAVKAPLDSVRAALPSNKSVFIRLVSKVGFVKQREAIGKALDAVNLGANVEQSVWPLSNGDIQIQVFERSRE